MPSEPGPRRRALIVFPTEWDRKQIAACRAPWQQHYDVTFAEPADADCDWDFDVLAWIDAVAARLRGQVDGVLSSSDYPGAAAAAALSAALGLPGSAPARVLETAHKHASRAVQARAAPEATPRFALVDADDPQPPPWGFPCFVKPVKGSFSLFARRCDDLAALRAFLMREPVRRFRHRFLAIFHQLLARYGDPGHDGRWFLAEELLHGDLVTVEGYATGESVEVLGVVDSIVDPATRSFVRFDYPSALPLAVQARMQDVARRTVAALGLTWTMFNVEMIYDAGRDRLAIIEVNPRMCGQFADLYQKVDGVHGYEIALALACGQVPATRRRQGAFGAAASFPLRVFEPCRVAAAPSRSAIEAAEASQPGTLVWNECAAGDELRDFESYEDGSSCRYAIINMGARHRDELLAAFGVLRDRLGWRFERS